MCFGLWYTQKLDLPFWYVFSSLSTEITVVETTFNYNSTDLDIADNTSEEYQNLVGNVQEVVRLSCHDLLRRYNGIIIPSFCIYSCYFYVIWILKSYILKKK